MKVLFLQLALLLTVSVFAQTNQYTSVADSDPRAKATLNEIRKKYDAYSNIRADFRLVIELPEQAAETQKGTITRQGDNYHMKLASYEVISDGKALYMILHNNREVQVNDIPDEEGSLLTPQSMFNFYENDNFVLLLAGEETKNGRQLQYIEMKPTDRNADYSKLRVTVDKTGKTIKEIKAFAKDGTRYTFYLDKVESNVSLPAAYFTFDKKKYDGYYVEDLRM